VGNYQDRERTLADTASGRLRRRASGFVTVTDVTRTTSTVHNTTIAHVCDQTLMVENTDALGEKERIKRGDWVRSFLFSASFTDEQWPDIPTRTYDLVAPMWRLEMFTPTTRIAMCEPSPRSKTAIATENKLSTSTQAPALVIWLISDESIVSPSCSCSPIVNSRLSQATFAAVDCVCCPQYTRLIQRYLSCHVGRIDFE
jgi:hypothetical protein